MANYHSVAKVIKRKTETDDIKYPSVAMENALLKNMHKKTAVPDSAWKINATTQLVDTMNLDEMLEASKMIEMEMKGEKIPVVKSPKAQEYAKTWFRLDQKFDTKSMAEKMLHDLNVQIIKVNKKTTDAEESKRLYRELMAEE